MMAGVAVQEARLGWTAQAQVPPEQALSVPQAVPFGSAPTLAQVGVAQAVAHTVAPRAHGLNGMMQAWSARQAATQAPAAQTSPLPHAAPSAFTPVAWQVPGLVISAQTTVPVAHGSAGWQAVGVTGSQSCVTQDPPMQTWPVPQVERSGFTPVVAQVGCAAGPEQVVRPKVQGFSGWQAWLPVQAATQVPLLQTPPAPQSVPESALPMSVQTAAAVALAQLVAATLHGLVEAHATFATQRSCVLVLVSLLLPQAASSASAVATTRWRVVMASPPGASQECGL
jgi:hypothetical protein